MIQCKIYGKKWNIYNCSNFPYTKFYNEEKDNYILKGKAKNKYKIYNIICSFDTESTTILAPRKIVKDKTIIEGDDIAFTYIWGFKISEYIIVGRYYEELIIFLSKIKDIFTLNNKDKIIMYCHNLSYDFQFMWQFLYKMDSENFKIFATDKRKILYFNIEGFQFRCSYKLTNMSLDRWCEKENGVKYKKLTGTMDYKKIIYPDENLKKNDFRYFIGDLISLYECIKCKLENDNKTLANIPLTSTGYAREYTKEETIHDYRYRYYISRMYLTPKVYDKCQLTKVGGDTHGNRFYQGEIIDSKEVGLFLSEDIKSSYPFSMLLYPVPVSNFIYYGEIKSLKELENVTNDFTCLFYVYFDHIMIKPFDPVSVISISKIIKADSIDIVDNGRLIEGHGIILAVNEVRFKHIKKHYNYKGIKVWDMYIAEKGLIPYEYRKCVFDLFKQKCELEKYKDTDKQWIYDKFKNLLNALFGMCLTDITHEEIYINNMDSTPEWNSSLNKSIEEQIEKYNKKWDRHLYYPWGIWIVDNARSNLYELISCCNDPVYWDTDSCKGFNWDLKKLEAYNNKRIKMLEDNNFVVDINGKKFYLGTAENDSKFPIKKFKTLGAKKYCYEDKKELHITIAGVSKKGAKKLKSIEDFKVGLTFDSEYAGQCAKYNDDEIHTLKTLKGKKFNTASNIALVDITYTLNACDDYLKRNNFTVLEVIN